MDKDREFSGGLTGGRYSRRRKRGEREHISKWNRMRIYNRRGNIGNSLFDGHSDWFLA